MTRGIGASLAHRNFRLFFAGQLVSLVGTWMQTVAQGWLVLTLTNDPFALGIVTACQFLPVLLFGLFGGVIADALPKRQTLIVTQIVALILALTLGILVVTNLVQVWMIYLLAIGLGFVNAVEMPVRQSFVVEMVGRPDVANAVALNSATFNLARVVGPAVAGLVIGLIGIAACFFLNAASFLAVLVAYLLMRDSELLPSPRIAVPHSVRAIAAQLREGLGYVRRTPTVRLAIVTLGVVATAGMNFSVLVPVYAQGHAGWQRHDLRLPDGRHRRRVADLCPDDRRRPASHAAPVGRRRRGPRRLAGGARAGQERAAGAAGHAPPRLGRHRHRGDHQHAHPDDRA